MSKIKPSAPKSVFMLGDVYELGREIGTEIHSQIEGRVCGVPHDWGIHAEVIAHAGDGDHLEIGTLFGGSAILAACIKEELGLSGRIVCVDPLDGYYGRGIDPISKTEVTKEQVISNAEMFGVEGRLRIISKMSQPWPFALRRRFASAFIDGDHKFDGAMSDWVAAEAQVDRIVLLDNYDSKHFNNSVVRLCMEIFQNYSQSWMPMHISGISVVLGKRTWVEGELWPKK